MSDTDDGLRETAWSLLAPGFMSYADVVAACRELAEDDDAVAFDADDAEALVEELWETRLVQLREPADRVPTDDARLAAAFNALNETGIVALMDCGVDQGDGTYLAVQQARAAKARGVVFFHTQDTERLAASNATLFLAFTSMLDASSQLTADDAAVAIAREVVDVLRRHGLSVTWDGSASKRLAVTGIEWRRALPERTT